MRESPVATVAAALWPVRQELRDAVGAAVVDQVAGARNAPRGELDPGLNVVVGALTKPIVSGEPLSAVDVTSVRETGRRWTAAGIDAETQAAVVWVAAQTAYRFLEGLTHRTRFPRRNDKQAAIYAIATGLMATVSSVQLTVASGATEAAHLAASRAAGLSLVDGVLAGLPADVEAAEEAGLREPCGLLVVLSAHPGPSDALDVVAQRAADLIGGLSGGVRGDPIAHVGVLASADDRTAWREKAAVVAEDVAESGCLLVVLPDPLRFTLLPSVYELCRERLHYATVLPSASPLLDVVELDVCAMLVDAHETLRSVVFDRVLGRLLSRPELFHVQDALVASGQMNEVPAMLGRSLSSVKRDVKAILKITGYDWNNPRDQFKLTLATHLRWSAAVSLVKFSEAAWGPTPKFTQLGFVR